MNRMIWGAVMVVSGLNMWASMSGYVPRSGIPLIGKRFVHMVRASVHPLHYHCGIPFTQMLHREYQELLHSTVIHGTSMLRHLCEQYSEVTRYFSGLDNDLLREYERCSHIHKDVRQRNILDAFELLLKYGYWQYSHEYSPIVADLRGDRFCYPLLIKRYGVDVNMRGACGKLPLDVAIERADAPAVALLLEWGGHASEDGRTLVNARIDQLCAEMREYVPWSPTFDPARWNEMYSEVCLLMDIYEQIEACTYT